MNDENPLSAEEATSRAGDSFAGARPCQATLAGRIGPAATFMPQSEVRVDSYTIGTESAEEQELCQVVEEGAWSRWAGSIVPAVRAVAAKYRGGRELVAILSVEGRGRAVLVLRIEERGELLAAVHSEHRDRMASLQIAQKWASERVAAWMKANHADAAKAARLSPEEMAFWADEFRRLVALGEAQAGETRRRSVRRRAFLVSNVITAIPHVISDLRREEMPRPESDWRGENAGSIGGPVEPVNAASSESAIHDIYWMMLLVVS